MGALDKGAKHDLIEVRREWVSKLRARQFTIREIVQALPKQNILNPETGHPYTIGTIQSDLKVLRNRWQKEAVRSTEEHLSRQYDEIQHIKRQAWLESNATLALRALELEMKLLGTLSPIKLQVDVTLVNQAMEALETLGQDPVKIFNEIIARAKAKRDVERN